MVFVIQKFMTAGTKDPPISAILQWYIAFSWSIIMRPRIKFHSPLQEFEPLRSIYLHTHWSIHKETSHLQLFLHSLLALPGMVIGKTDRFASVEMIFGEPTCICLMPSWTILLGVSFTPTTPFLSTFCAGSTASKPNFRVQSYYGISLGPNRQMILTKLIQSSFLFHMDKTC